jgi:hypothetical protein
MIPRPVPVVDADNFGGGGKWPHGNRNDQIRSELPGSHRNVTDGRNFDWRDFPSHCEEFLRFWERMENREELRT